MTIEQFSTLNPGPGTIMLYHSGSVVSAVNIDNGSCNNLNVSTALEELERIILNIGGVLYTTDIILVVTFPGYYHVLIEPITVVSTVDNFTCTTTALFPGISQVNFGKSDYQALKNNANQGRTTSFIFDVDRRTSQLIPQNYQAIISGSATPAQYQELNYSSIGITNSRYDGAKTNTNEYGVLAALSGTPFKAASYIITSETGFICSQSLSDRDIETFLFDGTGDTPVEGSRVFTLEKNKVLPIKNRKVWVKDSRQVLTLNENGVVSGAITNCSI
jgi:hypothetical protein